MEYLDVPAQAGDRFDSRLEAREYNEYEYNEVLVKLSESNWSLIFCVFQRGLQMKNTYATTKISRTPEPHKSIFESFLTSEVLMNIVPVRNFFQVCTLLEYFTCTPYIYVQLSVLIKFENHAIYYCVWKIETLLKATHILYSVVLFKMYRKIK